MSEFDADRQAIMDRAREANVTRILSIGIDLESSRKAVALAEKYHEVFAAVGWHPNSAGNFGDKEIKVLRELAAHPKVKAVGEIGLDYYRDRVPRESQQRTFRSQCDLAEELNLPIIIHCREAFDDVMQILRGRRQRGVMHSFGGDVDQAREVIELGMYVGLTGPITFPKAEGLRAVAASVPLDRLLIETDAPYLTPQPYRGKRNEPSYVKYVAQKLAETRNENFDTIAAQTSANAMNLFDWRDF